MHCTHPVGNLARMRAFFDWSNGTFMHSVPLLPVNACAVGNKIINPIFIVVKVKHNAGGNAALYLLLFSSSEMFSSEIYFII